MANVGPTANLPGYVRRTGRSGTTWEDGRQLGEVVSIEWTTEVEQITVIIAGSYRDERKPGAETRTGTFRFQDLHDKWALRVWRFLDARRRGDRSSAFFPEFDIVTKLDDIGAPAVTQWSVEGCQLFSYAGGHSQEDDLLQRDVAFAYRDDHPISAFEYTDGGVVVTNA